MESYDDASKVALRRWTPWDGFVMRVGFLFAITIFFVIAAAFFAGVIYRLISSVDDTMSSTAWSNADYAK